MDICLTDSLHCTAETNNFVKQLYSYKKKIFVLNDGTKWKNQGIKIFTVKTGIV